MSKGKVQGYLYVNFMTGGPHLVIGGGLGLDWQMFKNIDGIFYLKMPWIWECVELWLLVVLFLNEFLILFFPSLVLCRNGSGAGCCLLLCDDGEKNLRMSDPFPLLWRPRRSTKMVRARSAFLHKNDNFLFLDFFDGFSKHYPKYYGPAAWTWCMGVCEWMILRVHRLEFIHFWFFFSLPVIYLLRGVAWILAMP